MISPVFIIVQLLLLVRVVHSYRDPATWVTCSGPLPPFAYNIPPPSLLGGAALTLQHLCANANNGGIFDYTVQGFCAPRTVNSVYRQRPTDETLWTWDKEFRVSRDAIQSQGSLLRLAHYCMQRCKCDSPFPGQSLTPYYITQEMLNRGAILTWNPNEPSSWLPVNPPSYGFIDLPNTNNLLLEYSIQFSRRKWIEISAYSGAIDINTERIQGNPSTNPVRRRPIRLNPDHEIECAGPLPTFPLPNDVDLGRYGGSLQSLCATPLGGGDDDFSAGAYCRPNPQDVQEGDIDFADEMTPNPDWTWDGSFAANPGELPPRGIRLRNYCWNRCICPGKRRPRRRVMGKVWPYLSGEVKEWMVHDWKMKAAADPTPPKYDPERPASVGCFNSYSCIVMSLFGPQPQCPQGTAPPDARYMCQLDDKGQPTYQLPKNEPLPANSTDDVTIPDLPRPPADVATTNSTTDTQTPEPPSCYGACTSVDRGCPYQFTGGCKCGAPKVNLFFWTPANCLAARVFTDFSAAGSTLSGISGGGGRRHRRRQDSLPYLIVDDDDDDDESGAEDSIASTNHTFTSRARPVSASDAALATRGLLKTRQVEDENPVVPDNVLAAPCNETYISVACANSTDGLVWEAPEMWLGAPLPLNWTADTPLPRVPDEFYTVHGLVRAGDTGFLAHDDDNADA